MVWMVVDRIGWYSIVFNGIRGHLIVYDGTGWYWMVLMVSNGIDGIQWYSMVFDGIQWY